MNYSNLTHLCSYECPALRLFDRIKISRGNLNFTILQNELISEYYNINMHVFPELGLFTLYSDNTSCNLEHIDDLVNDVINECKLLIFDTHSLKPIVTYYNKSCKDNSVIKLIEDVDWKNINITRYFLNSKHVCLFYHNEKWLCCISETEIVPIDMSNDAPTTFAHQPDMNLKRISNDNLKILGFDVNKLNMLYSYHLLVKSESFRKLGFSDHPSQNEITLLWINDKNLNIIDDAQDIQYEKKCYFLSLNELTTSIDIMNSENMSSKKLSYGGYVLRILSPDSTHYTFCHMTTPIYKHILSQLPKHKNEYINYLQLYQNNKLGDILVYLDKYPVDVIRRINMSIKILSKELLNIYHLTRKKQNSDLYDCLPQCYKKSLYDLHKIYVDQKYVDQKFGDNLAKDDGLVEKRSISVDIVYNYLKNLQNEDLLEIYLSRKNLLDNLNNIGYDYASILNVTNIDIIAQIELMSS